MPNGETTNPRITLADVAVSEADCHKRTGEIMAIQRQTLNAVQIISSKLDKHVAWHRGTEQARDVGRKAGRYYVGIVSLALTAAALLGSTVWLLANR